jgi:hypothetical protein
VHNAQRKLLTKQFALSLLVAMVGALMVDMLSCGTHQRWNTQKMLRGGGGCIAYALCALGLFPTQKKAAAALDAAGAQIHERDRSKNGDDNCSKVYTKGETWCVEAILHVCNALRYDFINVAKGPGGDPDNNIRMAIAAAAAGGAQHSYLLEGTLAQTYLRTYASGKMEVKTLDPDDPPPSTDPYLWRHSVAIRCGRLWDLYNPTHGLSVEHLLQTKQPYFFRISKLWRIQPDTLECWVNRN